VLELIQILAACNATQFGANDHPIEAYKNSGKCLDYLLAPEDKYGYRRLAPVAKDIWRLYDTIRYKWWEFYNKPHPVTGKPGRAGRLVEVRDRKRGKVSLMRYVTLNVRGDPLAGDKHVEKGLAFPALAGFRALLQQGPDGNMAWKIDPFKFFEKHGIKVVGFWTEDIGTSNRLLYILGYESLADREKKWTAFMNDPDWLQVRAKTEAGGPLVARVLNSILRPTPYSPMK